MRRPISRSSMAVAAIAVLVLSVAMPTAASAAAPAAAVLVAPPDGGTVASTAPALSVSASDPDGGSLDVSFEGRRVGATVPGPTEAEPFTVVVVPDTQNYSYGPIDLLDAQLRWVRDSSAALDTAFVIQVGDLVSEWDTPRQWENVSTAFRILDDAAVPNTVVPGNHDFDATTGDLGPYNAHFPASRYSGASWNSATTRYGGHLGQDQFGPDPIDRGNGDSYALFSAGGRDFLVLNLEWEAPQYALDWADRVLDAHPDRTVIMATHSFVLTNGTRRTTAQRPGGTSQTALWEGFVRTHCQIRLVVSGHEHQGDLGEANRTDANACGQPVQQILTDYQARANGGDGWLRYYTFDPAANTMRATTYSPTLDRFETDADSAFTLPFELTAPQPAPFAPIATRTIASGGSASATWTGLAHDTEYEWRAVVDDGTTRATSSSWTLRTPPAAQAVLASDTFARTVSAGWGSADVGGAWALGLGSATPFSVDGARGLVSLAPGQTREARLTSTTGTSAVVDAQVTAPAAASGGAAHTTILGRQVGSSHYGLNVRFEPGGVLRVHLLYNNTALGTRVSTWTPGRPFQARLSVTGTGPTLLAGSVWPAGSPEPSSWQLAGSSTVAAMQTAGPVGIRSAVSASSTVAVSRIGIDDVRVVDPARVPAQNAAPVARFTTGGTGLGLTTDGRGSTDSDGTITGYAWTFGDGGTASGATASHTYAAAGTYTVGLTVTDDGGASASTSSSVTVAAPPPPNQPPTAAIAAPVITGRTVALDGSGSTDGDGTIASYAWQFGDGATGSAPTPTHTYATDGTRTVTLTVTDDDGATASATRSVSVTGAPPAGVLASDGFGRTVTGGWGSADTGGPWTLSGTATAFSVAGGAGVVAIGPGSTRDARLAGVSTANAVVTVRISADAAAAGGAASATVVGRMVGTATYSARLRLEPGGVIRLYLLRGEVALAGSYVLPGAYVPGEAIMLRVSVRGTSPTALGAMIWRASGTAPANWQLQATDATAALQTAGIVTLKSSISSSSIVATTRLRYDDYLVTAQ